MNYIEYFKILGKDGVIEINATDRENRPCNTIVSVHLKDITLKTLLNNIDLLAKKMHMEVELQAQLAREKERPKHKQIYLPDFYTDCIVKNR